MPSKCQILKSELDYLGHTIDANGVDPKKENVQAVKDMAVPKTVKEVRSFLGTVNYYGKFIPKIADMRKPLNDLLKKGVRFYWKNESRSIAYNIIETKPVIINKRIL